MVPRTSRRAFLGTVPVAIGAATVPAKKPKELPRVGEFVRFADPTTENPVVRLTSLASASRLPLPSSRFISAKERFLVFCSDRNGTMCPYRLDLRTGVLQQLTEGAKIDPLSLCLDEAERSLLYLEGSELKELSLSSHRVRTVADGVSQFAMGKAANDVIIRRGSTVARLDGGKVAEDVCRLCLVHPSGANCVFLRDKDGSETSLWLAHTGSQASEQRLASGRISCFFWSPAADSVLMLRETGTPAISHVVEVSLSGLPEQTVSGANQFACFAPNRDASVFVGASRSKAQPDVVLMLRSPVREKTLCEHDATQPGSVQPVFAPDSRRVYFETDREGRSAIYSVNVELLVEPTL